MFTAVLMYLQPMSLQHEPFPAAMKCMMTARVAGAMKEGKSDTNMSRNQYWALPKYTMLSKLLHHSFVHTTDKQYKQNIFTLEFVLFHLEP